MCATHGGSAPQVKRAAAERIAALVDPALDALTELLSPLIRDDVRLGAIKDILDRAGHSPKQKKELEHKGKLQVELIYADDEAPR